MTNVVAKRSLEPPVCNSQSNGDDLMAYGMSRRTLLVGAAAGITSTVLADDPSAKKSNAVASQGQKPRSLTLLHITDTHAQLETHLEYIPGAVPEFQMMGGFARLKTAIDRERTAATGACFLLDGGDEFQGSGPATWSEGEVILDPINTFGLDAYVPGNWDPAYGPKRFKELMGRLKAKVTCFNFHDTKTNERLFPPSLTFERHGVKVSFIGIADILSSKRQPPVEYEGMDTTRMEGLHDFVKELRAKEKPDLVVGITHTGITIARQLAREIPELDVVLSGHTHERTEEPILEGHVIVVEPGSLGSFLGRLDLTLRPEGGVAEHHYRMIPINEDDYQEDPEVKKLVDTGLAPYREKMNKIMGKTLTPIMRYDVLETNADDFITDAIREAAGTDIGLSNGFRFAPPIPVGELRNSDLWNLLPMDARMKAGWVTGHELRTYLEHELELVYSKNPMTLSGGWGPRASGLTMQYVVRADPGKRLLSVQVNGGEVKDDQHYSVASCEREGEPLEIVCRIQNTHDVKVLSVQLHEALRQYLKAHPVISPRREGRAYATDLAPVVFSQDAIVTEGLRGSFLPTIVPSKRKS
jgi:2',3'-cyclic-nucleotide 2'-phosphodiesterase (5'-nucleotidase family)